MPRRVGDILAQRASASMVGRERELEALLGLLGAHRLRCRTGELSLEPLEGLDVQFRNEDRIVGVARDQNEVVSRRRPGIHGPVVLAPDLPAGGGRGEADLEHALDGAPDPPDKVAAVLAPLVAARRPLVTVHEENPADFFTTPVECDVKTFGDRE